MVWAGASRLAVTPASPAMVLIAQTLGSFIQVVIGIAIAFEVAVVFFNANLPTQTGLVLCDDVRASAQKHHAVTREVTVGV